VSLLPPECKVPVRHAATLTSDACDARARLMMVRLVAVVHMPSWAGAMCECARCAHTRQRLEESERAMA
jgi:hypothetical protein